MSILGDLGHLLKFSLSSFVVPGSAPSKSNSAHDIYCVSLGCNIISGKQINFVPAVQMWFTRVVHFLSYMYVIPVTVNIQYVCTQDVSNKNIKKSFSRWTVCASIYLQYLQKQQYRVASYTIMPGKIWSTHSCSCVYTWTCMSCMRCIVRVGVCR